MLEIFNLLRSDLTALPFRLSLVRADLDFFSGRQTTPRVREPCGILRLTKNKLCATREVGGGRN